MGIKMLNPRNYYAVKLLKLSLFTIPTGISVSGSSPKIFKNKMKKYYIILSLSAFAEGKIFIFNQLIDASHFSLRFYKSKDATVLLMLKPEPNPNIRALKSQPEPGNVQKALVVTIRLLQTSGGSYKHLIGMQCLCKKI